MTVAKNNLTNSNNIVSLHVPHAHCHACVNLIEAELAEYQDQYKDDIINYHFNLTQKRLDITVASILVIDKLRTRLSKIGYATTIWHSSQHKKHNPYLLYLAVAGFGAVNVMMYSIALWADVNASMSQSMQSLFHILSLLVSLPCIIIGGIPFYRNAYFALSRLQAHMDIPIVVGVITATALSLHNYFYTELDIYFEAPLMLIFFLLIGRSVEYSLRDRIKDAASILLEQLQGYVWVQQGNSYNQKWVSEINTGDVIRIAMGEKIKLDGLLISQENAIIDNSAFSGESLPVHYQQGSKIYAGMVNLGDNIYIRVTATGGQTRLAKFAENIAKALDKRNKYHDLALRIIRYYTPLVHILALLTFGLWFADNQTSWQQAMTIAVSVLIITCPCALGLATPLAIAMTSYRLLKQGILLKNSAVIERAMQVQHIIFDKTGTLTLAEFEFSNKDSFDHGVLAIIKALASHSKHPLCLSLLTQLANVDAIANLDNIKEHKGQGVSAILDGKEVKLGNANFCTVMTADQYSPLWLSIDGVTFAIMMRDTIKPDAHDTIVKLRHMGYEISLISGDIPPIVKEVADKLAIKAYHSQMSHTQKYQYVKHQTSQHGTLMIGDGLNDAESLAVATASIAPAKALDVSQNAADVIIPHNKLTSVISFLRIAYNGLRTIKSNLLVALVYNVCVVPFAILGFINPPLAAIFMAVSSITVTLMSLFLYRN